MTKYPASTTFTSVLDPDITVTIRNLTRGARLQIERELKPIREKQRQLLEAYADYDKELQPFRDTARQGPCTCKHDDLEHNFIDRFCTARECAFCGTLIRTILPRCPTCDKLVPIRPCACRHPVFPADLRVRAETALAESNSWEELEIQPAYLRVMVEKIEGFTLDGEREATIEEFIDQAPEALRHEIYLAVDEAMRLTPEQIKNFGRPSTSPGSVDGPIESSTAPAVNGADSTKTNSSPSQPS